MGSLGILWRHTGLKKPDWCSYQNGKNCDDSTIRLDTVPALDRQTDRQTYGRICHNNIALGMRCMLARDDSYYKRKLRKKIK